MEPEVVAFPDMTSKWLRHVKENLRIWRKPCAEHHPVHQESVCIYYIYIYMVPYKSKYICLGSIIQWTFDSQVWPTSSDLYINACVKCLSNTVYTNTNVIHIHSTKSYNSMRSIFINYMIYFDLNDPYITPSESSDMNLNTSPHLWTKAPTVHPRHLQLLEVEVQEVENKGKMPRPGCWSHSFFLGKKTRIEKMRWNDTLRNNINLTTIFSDTYSNWGYRTEVAKKKAEKGLLWF